ncbi:hypothetical protein M2375_001987 [Comamonas sp. BIGb0152]|uniref:IPTL-CTERM sorting domain-containing protein n=1 Tax=Comamonas sp. BIGb0152 TaxID=2940601 RepID=UPI0021692CE0|nr:IPTL-CTERM sorting domain-containing protein [Comamonas sp. BIGb0152]MCS4293755.1 hypothetical protein [Comamonas sp. BIGb0152]
MHLASESATSHLNPLRAASPWGKTALHGSLLAGLFAAPQIALACPPNLNASTYTTQASDNGLTCVYTADPVAVTVNGWLATGLVQITGNTTVNGVLTVTDTNGNNSRGILVSGAGIGNFLKDVTINKPSGSNNAAGIEKAGSGVATFQGNVAVSSNTGAPSSTINTRDGVRNNSGTSNYQQNLNITSLGGTRSGLYVGAGTVTVSGNLLLDFQSNYYNTNFAPLWSQGGTTTVTGTTTVNTAVASGLTPAVVVTNSQVTLNGPTTVTAAGAGAAAVDIRAGGIAQWPLAGNTITASGAAGIGLQLRGNGSFSAGSGLIINAQGSSFNYLAATGSTSLDAVTATTAPVVWNADATSTATYTGNGGHYKGASQLAGGGQLTLNLNSTALWEATAASAFTVLNLQSDAVLDASLLPSLAATGNLSNAGGVVSLARSDASPNNTLALAGVYTANGGSLVLNTVLNDGSTSVSDVLQVTSTAAAGAPTLLSVLPDAASAPAFTTGKGILVVRVTGGAASSAASAFALPSGFLDAAGVRYELVRDADDGNWYLRSVAAAQLTVNKVVTAPAGAAPFAGEIPFTVTCTGPAASFSGSLVVAANQGSAAPLTIQQGSTCTVAEGTLPAAPTGYRWAEPSYTQPAAIAAGANTATITNTLVSNATPTDAGTLKQVPTLGTWAVSALSLGMALMGLGRMRRRTV